MASQGVTGREARAGRMASDCENLSISNSIMPPTGTMYVRCQCMSDVNVGKIAM